MTDQAPTATTPAPRPRFWRRAWNWVKARWLRAWSAVQPGPTAKRGATWALLATAATAGIIALSEFRPGFGPLLDPPAAALLALVILGFVFLGTVIAARLLGLVRRFLTWTGIGLVACSAVALMGWGLPEAGGLGALLMVAVIAGEACLGGALALVIAGGLRRGRVAKRIWLAFVICMAVAANAWMVYWLAQRGSGTDLVRPAPDQAVVTPLDLADPSKPGPFRVLTATYGSGADRRRPEFGANVRLKTKSVDGRPFVRGSSGWRATMRRWYWGFDYQQFPINGRVWYPDGPGPFPLVLIVHGNHAMEDFSDPGYTYLGEHLASRGFIFVSVDENFFNSSLRGWLTKENDARGWMLLQHLKVWTEWNGSAGNPFAGKVALDRIALIGHSRGGEAVAVAGAFNRLHYYPDDGRIEMPSGFAVRSIVAIAPVDGQYTPAGQPTPLENVNYLTLQGAHDSDVSSFDGIRQWARVRFTDGAEHVKAAVYIYRANHGQFNTVWGDSDSGFPMGLLLDRRSLLDGDDQRRAAKVFITSFLETTLQDKREYLAVLEDERRARAWLPDDLFVTRYDDEGAKKAEEDKKKEEKAKADPNKPERLDLSLELTSANGAVVRLPLSRFRAIPVVLRSRMTKLPNEESIFTKRAEPVLQSFAVPLSAFVQADPRFEPASLAAIRFVFDRSPRGVVALDDIGVRDAGKR